CAATNPRSAAAEPSPGAYPAMIVRSSNQVSRSRWLRRFPLPRNLGVSAESRIGVGKHWTAPPGARRLKRIEIYRFDPESGANPRRDSFDIDLDDCGPMLLDALIWIKNRVDPSLA